MFGIHERSMFSQWNGPAGHIRNSRTATNPSMQTHLINSHWQPFSQLASHISIETMQYGKLWRFDSGMQLTCRMRANTDIISRTAICPLNMMLCDTHSNPPFPAGENRLNELSTGIDIYLARVRTIFHGAELLAAGVIWPAHKEPRTFAILLFPSTQRAWRSARTRPHSAASSVPIARCVFMFCL